MKNYLPDVWDDDNKIWILFEEPRNQSVNPLDIEHKYKFWSDAILRWFTECRVTTFTYSDVKGAFSRKGRVPAYLPNTVLRMEREGHCKRLKESLEELGNDAGSTTLTRRFFSAVVVSPVKFGFSAAKWALGYDAQTMDEETQYVAVSVLEEKTTEVSNILKNRTGLSVFTAESFHREHHNLVNSKEEAVLILGQLMKNPNFSLIKEDDEYVVKSLMAKQESRGVADQHTPVRQPAKMMTLRTPVSTSCKPVITEAERSLAKFTHTLQLLHDEISTICEECQELRSKAAAAVKQGNRDQAKVFLRKKRRLEQLAEKRSIAISQLETMQETLMDAETDNMVLEAYKTANNALKSTLKDQLHGVTGVEATLDGLNELLQDHAEVSAVLSEPVRQVEEICASELEEELKRLMEEGPPPSPPPTVTMPTPPREDLGERLQRLRGERVPDLPDVPTFSPGRKQVLKFKI